MKISVIISSYNQRTRLKHCLDSAINMKCKFCDEIEIIVAEKKWIAENENKSIRIEEVSEKGNAYKNHNRLKAEITSKIERIEPKGIDAYNNRHCARYWFFSNNENCLFVESDDRRNSLHKVSSTHANNYEYFRPIWQDIDNDDFLYSSFVFFKNRKYEYKNVINSYLTDYKRDQKLANINSVYKFSLDFIQNNFNKIVNENYFISVDDLKNKYNLYCQDNNIKSNISTLNKYLEKINIIWNSEVDEIIGDDNPKNVTGIKLKSTIDKSLTDLRVDGVFIAIGHTPNTSLFENQLTMENGYLTIASGLEGGATATSIPGIFAAGDVADHIYRQAVTSAGFGCMAALDAEKYLDELV